MVSSRERPAIAKFAPRCEFTPRRRRRRRAAAAAAALSSMSDFASRFGPVAVVAGASEGLGAAFPQVHAGVDRGGAARGRA